MLFANSFINYVFVLPVSNMLAFLTFLQRLLTRPTGAGVLGVSKVLEARENSNSMLTARCRKVQPKENKARALTHYWMLGLQDTYMKKNQAQDTGTKLRRSQVVKEDKETSNHGDCRIIKILVQEIFCLFSSYESTWTAFLRAYLTCFLSGKPQ